MESEGSLLRLQQHVTCHNRSLKKNTERNVLQFMPSFRSDICSSHMDHYFSYRYKGKR